MTKRKPQGVSRESWIDRQVRAAEERGEFDNLPGQGRPIPGLDKPHDELWWLKQLLEREQLSVTPDGLTLCKEVEDAIERIRRQPTEAGVRRIVAETNQKIAEANAKAASGPPSSLAPFDEDQVVASWKTRNS